MSIDEGGTKSQLGSKGLGAHARFEGRSRGVASCTDAPSVCALHLLLWIVCFVLVSASHRSACGFRCLAFASLSKRGLQATGTPLRLEGGCNSHELFSVFVCFSRFRLRQGRFSRRQKCWGKGGEGGECAGCAAGVRAAPSGCRCRVYSCAHSVSGDAAGLRVHQSPNRKEREREKKRRHQRLPLLTSRPAMAVWICSSARLASASR